MAMESLLPQLLSFPQHPPPQTPLTDAEYDKQIRVIVQNLNTVPASKLTSGVAGGGDLLDVSALFRSRASQKFWPTHYYL